MITYEWRIKPSSDPDGGLDVCDIGKRKAVVTHVPFELIATDTETGASQSVHGKMGLPTDDLGDFTAVGKLTQDQIVGWLDNHPVAERYKEEAAGALGESSSKVVPLPWEG